MAGIYLTLEHHNGNRAERLAEHAESTQDSKAEK
jgi:hypothetical protein